jgi:hypothetical protein
VLKKNLSAGKDIGPLHKTQWPVLKIKAMIKTVLQVHLLSGRQQAVMPPVLAPLQTILERR